MQRNNSNGAKTPSRSIMSPGVRTGDASGQKTPRKVQWLDDNDPSRNSPVHALDEHGLDASSLLPPFV